MFLVHIFNKKYFVRYLIFCLQAVAEAGLAVNLVVLVPLTENMPGGKATKPGDVVTAMNGKTIQVSGRAL